jgi:hypothetical protein
MWPVLETIINWTAPVSYEDQHVNRYTKWRLRRELELSGFVDIELGTFLLFGPFLGSKPQKRRGPAPTTGLYQNSQTLTHPA